MVRYITALLATAVLSVAAKAEKNLYPVSEIPDSLLQNADVIKRSDQLIVTIVSAGKAYIKRSFVYTILNENGDRYAGFSEYYNHFQDINYMEGKLYDASGKEIGRVHKKDINDLSANEGTSISETRYKVHRFYFKTYPYTVAYEWEVVTSQIFSLPDWMPQERSKEAVQSSSFNVSVPSSYKLRYKEYNCTGKAGITTEKDRTIFTWSVTNTPAVKYEDYAPDWNRILPNVKIAPSEFSMDGYNGNMNTWRDYGKFSYQLNNGRDILPDDVKRKVHQLTDELTSDAEKIKTLYDYLQQNTRYVYVGFGIGSWQPQPAGYVAKNGYGDCKALSNYMASLLKEAGIYARYAIIKSGDNCQKDLDETFVSNQSDHIILCVPDGKDTTWLECTSQTLPAGYLSGFTCNRPAILVDVTGGTVVHTPAYKINDNLQSRKVSAKLDEQGNLSVLATTQYRALQQDDMHGMINALSKEKVMKMLKTYLDLPTYDVASFDYKQDRQTIPSVFESLGLTVSNYAQVSGKRLFIQPNVMTRSSGKLKANEKRKYDIEFDNEYNYLDSVEITLPPGYTTESLPQSVKLESKFGQYNSSVKVMPEKIIYYRDMKTYSGLFQASDYDELVKFYDAIYKADRAKVVLVKNTGN